MQAVKPLRYQLALVAMQPQSIIGTEMVGTALWRLIGVLVIGCCVGGQTKREP